MKKLLILTLGVALLGLVSANAQEKKEGKRSIPPEILEKYDKNKDGKLDDSEKEAAKKGREERQKEMLKKFDKDGDGKLSDSEKEAAKEEFKKNRKKN